MRLAALIPALAIVSGDATAHSWYAVTNDPVTGFSCCGGTDCAPIPDSDVDETRGGYTDLPTGEFIPRLRVQRRRDWQFHRCIYQSDFLNLDQGSFRKGYTRCFFAPQREMAMKLPESKRSPMVSPFAVVQHY
jgi:hypothetical protein